MKGKLSDHPLAELIREIGIKRLSGTLRLEHDRARTAVYFERGRLVFAASNLRTLRLREYVSKNNLVSPKELSSLSANGSDITLARALSSSGALTQVQVEGLLTGLVGDVLRVALLWTEGHWEFDERTHLNDKVNIKIDVSVLMREAAQRMPVKFIGTRFKNRAETLSRAPVGDSQAFVSAESFVLSRLDAPTPLNELVAISGLREPEAMRTIYGLALAGVIQRQYWHHAFRDIAKSVVPEEEEIAPAVVEKPAEGTWTLDNRDAELEQFLEHIEKAADHYEIFDLTPNAGAEQIKDTYYTLARSYHPDRFHLKSGTSFHSRLSTAFAKVTQAYETLTDPASRSTYDATLERRRQFAGSTPPPAGPPPPGVEDVDEDLGPGDSGLGQAEWNFREGFGALNQGRINAAITHLAAAARLAPGDARFRAYYGKALAAEERTRRLAESEIQAAVRIDGSNPIYRTMLAELYFDLKFHKRAQTELARALELDPNNTSALLLQRKLDRSKR